MKRSGRGIQGPSDFFDTIVLGERMPLHWISGSSDPRYGGIITNAAMLSMTSGSKRTHPIARGAWIIEVIFNDPPPPPPNDVSPLIEDESGQDLPIRETFAEHHKNPSCAGCHSRLDPLGFAMENFDLTGRWRDQYENGRPVDSSGTLLRTYSFDGVVGFKESLMKEDQRFARAFVGHLQRFALARELGPADSLTIDAIVRKTAEDGFRLRSMIREVAVHSNAASDVDEAEDIVAVDQVPNTAQRLLTCQRSFGFRHPQQQRPTVPFTRLLENGARVLSHGAVPDPFRLAR